MNRFMLLIIGLIFSVFVIAGCGNPVKNSIEDSIAKELPGLIGPADSYTVNTYGRTLRVINGKLEGVDITGKNVKFSDKIIVSQLDVKVRDIVVDKNTHELRRVGSTEYIATISEAEINKYLKKHYPDVRDLRVVAQEKYLTISATTGVSVVRAGVKADVGLIVKNKRYVQLDLRTLKVAGINSPAFAREFLESQIDTIFDARDLGYDAEIAAVDIHPGALTLNGNLNLMKFSQQAQAKN